MLFIPFLVQLAFKIIMDYEHEKKPKKTDYVTEVLTMKSFRLINYYYCHQLE